MRKRRTMFTPTGSDSFRRLPPLVKAAVKSLIESLATDPQQGKPLREEFCGYYSARYQRWRIIYSLHDRQRLVIHLIERRVSVYETLKTLPPLILHERRARYARSARPTTP